MPTLLKHDKRRPGMPAFRMEPYDTKTRWFVESETEADKWYLVDLMANVCIGRCTCKDFTFRKAAIAERATFPSDNLRCKHLRHAREQMLNALLQKIGEFETNRENE